MGDVRTFRASDGYNFYYRRYQPSGGTRARLIIVHGIRSHSAWYSRSCESIAAAGIEVCFLDRRGSGLNTTRRGDFPSFRRLLDDIAEFGKSLREERAFLPLFLAGISWGGKLAAALPYRQPGLVDGLILVAPGLVPRIAPSFAERARILASGLLRPSRYFPIPLNEPELFTGSSDWQKYINDDVLGLRLATARALWASFGLDIYLCRAAKRVAVPALVLLAGQDRIINNPGTREFVSRFKGATTIIEYPEAHHTLEFEPEMHPWIDDVKRWLETRIE